MQNMGRRVIGRLIYTATSTLHARTHHYSRLCEGPSTRFFDYITGRSSKPGLLPWHAHFHAHAVQHMQKHVGSAGPGPTKEIDTAHTHLSDEERRRLLKLVDMEDLKKQLRSTGRDCMPYADVINLFQESGLATTDSEASTILERLDNAGAIIILRNRVFVRPDQVAELIANVLPLALAGDNDPRREELRRLETEKEEIDKAAQTQVRRMLWVGFGALSLQSLLFFRLTFWDLSWDVMEPITFFVTSSAMLAGLLFFIFTRREPSYQDLMHTLFSMKQKKLIKKNKFDAERLKQLQMMHCCLPPPPQNYH